MHTHLHKNKIHPHPPLSIYPSISFTLQQHTTYNQKKTQNQPPPSPPSQSTSVTMSLSQPSSVSVSPPPSSSSSSSSSSSTRSSHSHSQSQSHFSHFSEKTMIAGYVAGMTGTIVGYPLDTLKLWMQTNRGPGPGLGGFVVNNRIIFRPPPSSPSTTAGAATTSTTTKAFASILRLKTCLQALYSGVSAPLLTVGFIQSINFVVYDTTRRYLSHDHHRHRHRHHQFSSATAAAAAGTYGLQNLTSNSSNNNNNNSYSSSSATTTTTTTHTIMKDDPIENVAIAGFVSGTVTAIITAPLILIKTHQQITGRSSSFRKAWNELSVWKGCRAGFVPHLICESFGRSVYYASYETMKRTFSRMNQQNQMNHHHHHHHQEKEAGSFYYDAAGNYGICTSASADVSLGQRMVCAASSGILCWSLIFPLDTLRSRVYSEFVNVDGGRITTSTTTTSGSGSRSAVGSSSSSCTQSRISGSSRLVRTIRTLYNEQSFYRGFRVTVLRAGPVAAVVLPVYDIVLDTLSSSS